MRFNALIFSFLFGAGMCWSQAKPFVSAGYGVLLKYYRFQEFEFGAGVTFGNRISTQINYQHLYYEFDFNPVVESMKSQILSISTGYRFLNENYIVSPALMVDVGVPIKSNADGELMQHYFRIEEEYSSGMVRFNRGIMFTKLKALCDLKLHSFNLLIGASYNMYVFNISELKPSYWIPTADGYDIVRDFKFIMHNFGLDASLRYTLPFKKNEK